MGLIFDDYLYLLHNSHIMKNSYPIEETHSWKKHIYGSPRHKKHIHGSPRQRPKTSTTFNQTSSGKRFTQTRQVVISVTSFFMSFNIYVYLGLLLQYCHTSLLFDLKKCIVRERVAFHCLNAEVYIEKLCIIFSQKWYLQCKVFQKYETVFPKKKLISQK